MLPWHEAHVASKAAASGAHIPAHALLECYSVLTRLPQPLASEDAGALLGARFATDHILVPTPELQASVVERCASLGISGGAVYDALIAMTAKAEGVLLLTRDRRASGTYERIGVDFRSI